MSKVFDDVLLVEAYRRYRRCRIVAEMYGCSDETVRRALIKYNEPRILRHPRKTTRKRITSDEVDAILKDYYEENSSITELARKYHRAQETISRAIKEQGQGLKGRVNGRKITDLELVEESKYLTLAEIAKKHSMSCENVYKRSRKLGLELKGDHGHWYKRASFYGCNNFDKSITIEGLILKYDGICQLCGKPVDKFDIKNGHIRRNYPTLDHIIPLSKGGTHTWDNVQLAHMSCNSGKCDKVKSYA